MPKAFQQIVDVYVRFNNKPRLAELRAQREQLLADITARTSGYDARNVTMQIEEEIAIINGGLEALSERQATS